MGTSRFGSLHPFRFGCELPKLVASGRNCGGRSWHPACSVRGRMGRRTVIGLTTEKKHEPGRPSRDGERTPTEEPRDRSPEKDTGHDDRAVGEQPRVARRPPGRLPIR
jgi:hypothetical protein